MSVHSTNELEEHINHEVAVTLYGRHGDYVNASLECEECGLVLVDYDNKPKTSAQYEQLAKHAEHGIKVVKIENEVFVKCAVCNETLLSFK